MELREGMFQTIAPIDDLKTAVKYRKMTNCLLLSENPVTFLDEEVHLCVVFALGISSEEIVAFEEDMTDPNKVAQVVEFLEENIKGFFLTEYRLVEDVKIWQKIKPEDIPSAFTLKSLLQRELSLLMLHDKHDPIFIDVSSPEKLKHAGYYIVQYRLDYGLYYPVLSEYWNGEARSEENIAEDILALKETEFDKGAALAWWFISKHKDREYDGYSFEHVVDPISKSAMEE